MALIPLASLINFFNMLVAIACALILLMRRKTLAWGNEFVTRFFSAFVLSIIQFFFASAMGFWIHDPFLVQAFCILQDILTVVVMVPLIFIPLKIFYKNNVIAKISSVILYSFAGFYFIYNMLFLKPATPVIFGPFIDWKGSTNPLLGGILWAVVAICLLGIVSLFAFNGWNHQEDLLRRRARFFATGFFLMFLGWLVVFLFVTPLTKSVSILGAGGAVGCAMVSVGYVLILLAVLTKPKTI